MIFDYDIPNSILFSSRKAHVSCYLRFVLVSKYKSLIIYTIFIHFSIFIYAKSNTPISILYYCFILYSFIVISLHVVKTTIFLFSVLKFFEVPTHAKMGREDKATWKTNYFTKIIVSINYYKCIILNVTLSKRGFN